MSMLEVTQGKEVVKETFKSLITYAKELGYETILDVAPTIFDELQISYDDLTFLMKLVLMVFVWMLDLMETKKQN